MDTVPTIHDLGIDHWSVDDRLRLIGEIWDSIDSSRQFEIPQHHREELERRIDAYEANPMAGAPLDEVMDRLQKRA